MARQSSTIPSACPRLAKAGVAGAVLALAASSAWAQALPATGIAVPNDNLRGQLQQYFPSLQNGPPGPAWVFASSLAVDLGATDNATLGQRSGGDIFTIITPSFSLQGDTSRLRVNLSYSPVVSVYFTQTDQTRVDQYLSGSARAVIVPDSVFLNAQAQVSQQSRFGGFSDSNTQFLNRQDQVQTSSFSIGPSAERRFGGWGVGRVSYVLARTIQDGRDNVNSLGTTTNAFGQVSPAFGTTGNLTTQAERASFVTGENLGRVNDIVSLEAVQYSGSPTYRGAHRNSINNELSYALTRTIAVQGGIGYQDLQFPGPPPYRINEATWNGGVRLTPNADSSLTILYGRRDGVSAVSFDGTYVPTARTRIFGRYSSGLTSGLEEQQSLLDTASVGAGGLLTDNLTGAPIISTGSAFGTQNSLYKVKRLSISGVLMLDRDSFTATIVNEDRTTVTNSTNFNGTVLVPAGTGSNGTTGSIAWQHDISTDLNSVASVQYGIYSNAGVLGTSSSQSQRSLSLTASVNRQFSSTLTGHVIYVFSDRSGGQGNLFASGAPAANTTQNTLLVGLRKSF